MNRAIGKDREHPGFVSAQQVADSAGVSRSAVSRAFTSGASISQATRDKVMRAAEELGYHVNDLARGLLARRSRLVGLVATKPEVGFRAQLTAELAKALIRRGSVPVLVNTGETAEELIAAQKTLLGYRAEATIVISGAPPSSFVDLARRNGQPLIVLGRSEPGADQVRMDNTAAARRTAALFVAQGIRVLGLAGSHSSTPSVVERETAFRDEARRRGARVLWARGADADYAGGMEAARQLFADSERPEAVFCVDDQLAFGVMDFARAERGLAVPGDLSVVGFDDVPEAGWLSYGLTTFRQDAHEMAEAAVRLLDLRQANRDRPAARRRILPEFIVRRSFVPLAEAR
ncbi:MAG TPA: LacI family DNA-binding transcriptional regulator [Dongiaceae bacterium]|jgi:DNA-binding LacI/PurR family transcriptional regulator|nr:LacI family DNA-binding transcriptional regulator [Dongiaceae bacterium]